MILALFLAVSTIVSALTGTGATWNQAAQVMATIAAEVAGFSDVGDDGCIDTMFVAPKFGRRGVAGALLAHLHDIAVRAGATQLRASRRSTGSRPASSPTGMTVDGLSWF
ncbi:GNAT family N-acetyltransferase [Arthrobacter sp. 24S4-2]|uniref:GNAT family N-acetyltransferase n=1 Tax=Arthrobacter sp. 24S4-2 TaxID=2575374 RepID=UPI0010C7CBAC|nr:GNAT family N-acetyltransferase [Arthrobacter sp. 24S4-2]QCO98845.1 GNAT family N-acetyltransferase [Arthrobacter sp. 24S4-2]